VLVSNAYGATQANAATVVIGSGAVLLNQPQSIAAATGATVVFSALAGGNMPTYQWQFDGIDLPGATSPTLTLSDVGAAQVGSYTVVISAQGTVAVSVPATLIVTLPTSTIVSAPVSQSIGLGSAATFAVTANGSNLTYQWEKNGTPIPGATGATYTIGAVQPGDTGEYSVVISNSGGSVTTAAGQLAVDLAPGAQYLSQWTATSGLLSATQYTSVAYDGSDFLAAGSDGSLFLSADAAHWTALPTAPGRLNSLIYAGAPYGFLGVGDNGVILSFAGPGYAALPQTSGSSQLLTGVAVGNGRMVAVGFAGTVLAADFASALWSPGASGTTSNLNAVAYGQGLFVAVGIGGTVLTSSDGVEWTSRALGSAADLYSIAAGPAGFVALGNSGGSSPIFTSSDGINWTDQAPVPGVGLIRLVTAHGAFVAVGADGAVATSTNGGFTWSLASSGTTATLEGVGYGPGYFLAVGADGQVTRSGQSVSSLVNLSSRAQVADDAGALVAGFTVSGSGTLPVLMRGIGPSLGEFGVSGALSAAQMTLYGSNTLPLASNANWSLTPSLAAVFTQTGAFPLTAGSADAAMERTLNPGSYSVRVSGVGGATGVALAEIYNAGSITAPVRLVNVSTLAQVGTGSNVLASGFVIAGTDADYVLVRAVGPGLSPFGLSGLLANPVLTLYNSAGQVVASNSQWGGTAALIQAFLAVGAFSLDPNSSDAALSVALPPGTYSAVVSGAANSTGTAILEVYEEASP
jgi:hypothetical protein